MKIALVHMRHKATGGTERYLDQTARYLALRGHAVTIVCRSHEAAPHPDVAFRVLRSFAPGAGARMWAFARAVERHVVGADYDVVYGLGRTWSQDVLRLGGGLVATHLEHAQRSLSGAAGRLRLASSLKWKLAREVERRAFSADPPPLVVVNSELVRTDLLARYPVPPERVRVIHNAADPERFHPARHAAAGAELRARWGFDPEQHVYLFLGTGYRRKGLAVLLRAFARCVHASRGAERAARLAVVGHDSGAARYAGLARDLGIGHLVHFAGGTRQPEVAFAAADVYVLPTFYDPFANSTVEALSAGLPVVTTTTNGGAERVEPGVTGTLVPPGDVAALARALAEWSASTRCRVARDAARAAALAFDESAAMQATLAVLEEIATKRSIELR